jgi:hypothetical protein
MRQGITAALLLAAALCGCAQAQQFTAGDLTNAEHLAGAADPIGAGCWHALGAAAAPTSNPADDGFAVLAERKRLIEAAIGGPCGAVVAPLLLQAIHL